MAPVNAGQYASGGCVIVVPGGVVDRGVDGLARWVRRIDDDLGDRGASELGDRGATDLLDVAVELPTRAAIERIKDPFARVRVSAAIRIARAGVHDLVVRIHRVVRRVFFRDGAHELLQGHDRPTGRDLAR